MVDAVESGGFGVLGLYAAQAPAVSEPPRPPAPASAQAAPDRAAPVLVPVEPAQAVGSGPVAPADPGGDGSAAPGRDFARDSLALGRQAALAVSLVAAPAVQTASASGPAASAAPNAPLPHRASRAYARIRSIDGARPAGAMFSVKA